jgi:hypothetical protein
MSVGALGTPEESDAVSDRMQDVRVGKKRSRRWWHSAAQLTDHRNVHDCRGSAVGAATTREISGKNAVKVLSADNQGRVIVVEDEGGALELVCLREGADACLERGVH